MSWLVADVTDLIMYRLLEDHLHVSGLWDNPSYMFPRVFEIYSSISNTLWEFNSSLLKMVIEIVELPIDSIVDLSIVT